MPTEPDHADAPLPSELPCWYGFVWKSSPPGDNQELAAQGESNKVVTPRTTTARDVLGFVAVVAGLIALLAAVLLSVVSVVLGRGRLIAALALVHLPYVVFVVRVMYLTRRHDVERRQDEEMPPEELLQSSLGFLAMRKATVRAEGVFLNDEPTEWNRFTHAEPLREAEVYFVIRLHKHPEMLRSVLAPFVATAKEVPSRPKRLDWEDVFTGFSLVTPPAVTMYLAVQGWLAHGWRIDIAAAACLVTFYALVIPLLIAVRFTQGDTLEKMAQQKESATLDLLFDTRQVSVGEATTRINNWVAASGA